MSIYGSFSIITSLFDLLSAIWQLKQHSHLSVNWRNSSPVLYVLASILTLRLYLVYTLSASNVWMGYH